MGCDIHLYREKKINGVWVTADKWSDPYDEGMIVDYDDRAFTGRNYDLFGFLADVRRDIPGGFEPRGTPEDVCDLLAKEIESWDGDGHSHSYLHLQELKDAVERLKTETSPISGMMRHAQWGDLQASIATGAPDWSLLYPYCAWASDSENYTSFEVQVPAMFAFGECLQQIIDSFDGIDGDDHRIVFFFDN